jgi:hypothetical protein
MRLKYKLLFLAVLLADLAILYRFSGPSAESVAVVASPTDGMVGGTTEAAADRAKHDAYQARKDPDAVPVADGVAPPAPAQQLAPLTKGAGDMVDDVPVGAEVAGDAVEAPASAPAEPTPAPAAE